MQVPSILQGESLNQDLQTDASQHIAAIARWDNEGGARKPLMWSSNE
jgi:hypothetical protein